MTTEVNLNIDEVKKIFDLDFNLDILIIHIYRINGLEQRRAWSENHFWRDRLIVC